MTHICVSKLTIIGSVEWGADEKVFTPVCWCQVGQSCIKWRSTFSLFFVRPSLGLGDREFGLKLLALGIPVWLPRGVSWSVLRLVCLFCVGYQRGVSWILLGSFTLFLQRIVFYNGCIPGIYDFVCLTIDNFGEFVLPVVLRQFVSSFYKFAGLTVLLCAWLFRILCGLCMVGIQRWTDVG